MIRIFLAHASEDKEAVIDLYQRLKESGFQPWLDKVNLLPGQNWRAEIPKAIKNSQVFIACLSEKSVQKQGYIQREFRMALNAMADRPPGQIYLIPVRLDDCQIPELRQEEYGISLIDYQWINLYEPDGYDRLIQGIRAGFADVLEDANHNVSVSNIRTKGVESANPPPPPPQRTLTPAQRLKLEAQRRTLDKLTAKLKAYDSTIEESLDPDIKVSYERRKDRLLDDISQAIREIREIEQGNG